ncbi:MAG: 3'-5' exonuclease [Schleiferiaceae bacterium]|nr:3'-5' exonuclease [Schleiferiaceae bacterium]
MLLKNLNLQKVLFLDIETVSGVSQFSELSEEWQKLYADKTKWQRKDEYSPEEFYAKQAGIYAEFGKIICISCGFLRQSGSQTEFHVKSFYGDDEKILLQEFADIVTQHFNTPYHLLCGHNAKEFDFPYIGRRMLINGIQIPDTLNLAGKKPWEVQHLDTMELWKFGDYKHYTSLKLLAALFGIPTPKDDIDGSQVGSVYYNDNDLERIRIYCEKDTLTVAQLLLKYQGLPLITDNNIITSK